MFVRDFPWSRWVPWFVTAAVFMVLFAILAPAIQHSREAAWRSTSKNNLKNLGIAFYNYHDTHGRFPPGGIINQDGVAYHGWFTFIRFQMDPGYWWSSHVDYDYPWTDPENIRFFYAAPSNVLIPGETDEFTSDGFALIHYQANPNLFHRNSSLRLKDLKPGLSKTWMLGEAVGNHQPWGYPFNWRELGGELNAGPNSYGRPTKDGAFFLMGDGSVQFLSNDVDSEILKTWATAPSVPPVKATKRPNRRFKYGPGRAWKAEFVPLESNEEWELFATAYSDSQGVPQWVVFPETVLVDDSFESTRAFMTDDLRKTAERFPKMRALCNGPRIDDEAAQVLAGFRELEFLQVDEVTVSQAGIGELQKLRRLRTLRGSMSDELEAQLSAALSRCDIQNTRRPAKNDQLPDSS